MEKIKNVQFTKLIKSADKLREFNFRKSMGLEGPVMTVDVADQYGGRHYLLYRLEEGNWVLKTQNMPPWIEEAIPEVNRALNESVEMS